MHPDESKSLATLGIVSPEWTTVLLRHVGRSSASAGRLYWLAIATSAPATAPWTRSKPEIRGEPTSLRSSVGLLNRRVHARNRAVRFLVFIAIAAGAYYYAAQRQIDRV